MMRSFVCIPLDGLLELYDNLPQINKRSSKLTAFSLGKCEYFTFTKCVSAKTLEP